MTQFVLNPADPFAKADGEYKMIGHADISIQIAPYARKAGEEFTVNVWVEAEEAMYHYPFRNLADAKAKAIELSKGTI
jgi:hypothetical protein